MTPLYGLGSKADLLTSTVGTDNDALSKVDNCISPALAQLLFTVNDDQQRRSQLKDE